MADDLDILWVQFCSEKDNILLGVVYIPPENSPYSNINLFDDLENNLIYLKGDVENCKICLMGDFNSRTAEMSDNLLTETRMDSCDDFENELLIHAHALNVCNISLSRSSGDDICNNYGYRFVDFCKNMGLYIANGRCGEDCNIGKTTCKGTSLVDYIVISHDLFPIVKMFVVEDFNSMLSDIHNPVICTLAYNVKYNNANSETKDDLIDDAVYKVAPIKPTWKSETECMFKHELSHKHQNKINDIDLQLNNMLRSGVDDQTSINAIAQSICNILVETADTLELINKRGATKQKRARTLDHKPWYDSDCEKHRKHFTKTRRIYNSKKTQEAKTDMTASSKSYKASLNKAFNKYQKDMQNKIRNLKSTDPKVYWQIINKSADDHTRQEVKKISMQIFVEHFKKLNTNDSKRDEGDVTDNTNIDNLNVELNKPFEPDEVKKSIKKLKKIKLVAMIKY